MATFQQYNISPWLTPVRVVATGNVAGTYYNGPLNNGVGATFTASSGVLTIDSVVINVGDRVLLAGQSSGLQNGIYVCNIAGASGVQAVLQRSADQACIEQMHTGFYVTVAAGTVNAGSAFVLVEPKPQQIGVDSIEWTASPLNTGFGTAAEKDASDDAQPTVASVSGVIAANNLAVFADNAGTVKVATTTTSLSQPLIVSGSIHAGLSAVAGNLVSFPSAVTSGSLSLSAANNSGNFGVVISNQSHGQDTVYKIADVHEAAGSLLSSAIDSADPNANLVTFNVTCGQAALAGGGVVLYTSSGLSQYRVISLSINSGGTNFSGGGGDRLGQITDGTTVYSVIPAASLQTLANAVWGSTALPLPASAPMNTLTGVAADLEFQYSGGAADYTAGSIVISGVLQKIV